MITFYKKAGDSNFYIFKGKKNIGIMEPVSNSAQKRVSLFGKDRHTFFCNRSDTFLNIQSQIETIMTKTVEQ